MIGNQLRAARALAGLEQVELAALAGVHVNSIRTMEAAGRGKVIGRPSTIDAVHRGLACAGVVITGGARPGIRLRRKDTRPPDRLPPVKPREIETPGLRWIARRSGWTGYWVCPAPIRTAGYPLKTQRLWPPSAGQGATQPTKAEWKTIGQACVRLDREAREWDQHRMPAARRPTSGIL